MGLPRRQLGSSDLSITTVGFGAWAAGGGDWSFGWGPQDDADSIAAMRRALRHGTTVSSVAIGWTLAWSGVTGAIVGARTAKQVDGWIGGADIQLTAKDLEEISSLIGSTEAGKGPSDPR